VIDRFNFYDVYGYLIPGLVFLLLMWIPLGIATGTAPTMSFSDAIASLVVAYIVGHLLYGISSEVFAPGRRTDDNSLRYPSDDLLDPSMGVTPAEQIENWARRIKTHFAIDISDPSLSEEERRARRRQAFMLSRSRVVAEGKGTYFEQFEGMYALMRGVFVATLVGSSYFIGWLLGTIVSWSTRAITIVWLILSVATGVAIIWQWWNSLLTGRQVLVKLSPKEKKSRLSRARIILCALTVIALLGGTVLGQRYNLANSQALWFAGCCLGCLFVGAVAYDRFKYFTGEFAKAVYRDYVQLP
jgi:hypothetical protein